MAEAQVVRWGIIGSAKIARKVCYAIQQASNATCVAVASRGIEKATTFVDANCPGATAYGSYDELLADDRVQVVYLPLPTGLRCEWVVKCAERKKHVLSEKPVAPNKEDLDRMLEACRTHGVQFMDDTMMMHGERSDSIHKVLQDVEFFGTPRHVTSTFTTARAHQEGWASTNIRLNAALEPQGVLGDLGWYCARIALLAFNFEDPEAVSCHFLEETAEGLPVMASALMKFSGGRTSVFDCSYKVARRNWAEIASEKCVLRIRDFIIPASSTLSYEVYQSGVDEMELTFPIEVIKAEEFSGAPQSVRLIQDLSAIVLKGNLEEEWPRMARQTQQILFALEASARQGGAWVKPAP